ncbi:MAG: DNA methylase [Bacteroidaceae bacterium]|nr:DNA methylase [Bacteroidaceae bacterium]
MNVSKYFTGINIEIKRSLIHFADYNPREISEEERKNIKRGIKKFGLLGGLVVNKQTGFTIVQGHQRISVMDELEKFNPDTKENDYVVRAEVIDVDLKKEKVINILLNNPNAQGKWNRDKLAQLVAEKIEYKDAGLTDADLSLLGLDYMFQTSEEQNIADELGELMQGVEAEKEAEREERRAEKLAQQQAERAAKVAHMNEVKQEVRDAAQKSADNMDAYVMLSFSDITARNNFLMRFGYDADQKFIKGEDFDMRVEAVDIDEEE